MSRTLLIDADTLVHEHLYRNLVTFEWDEGVEISSFDSKVAQIEIQDHVARLMDDLDAEFVVMCLTDRKRGDNWRIQVMSGYKGNRGPDKPPAFWEIQDYLHETFQTYERPTLEGDDVLGILATSPSLFKSEKVIVSIDKDLQTIPSRQQHGVYNWLFNPKKDKAPRLIPEYDADHYWMLQTLMGDRVDSYKGIPGVGPRRAEKILRGATTLPEMWFRVVEAYQQAGLTAEDALRHARVAKILRREDYDFHKREVKLWNPPPGE